MLFMALLLVVASIWILEDRTMSLLLSASGGAKLTSLSGRPLESFSDSMGLTARERDVFKRPLQSLLPSWSSAQMPPRI